MYDIRVTLVLETPSATSGDCFSLSPDTRVTLYVRVRKAGFR